MKSVSSLVVARLTIGVFVILVFLLQTLALAEGSLTPALVDNENNLNLVIEMKEEFVMPTADSMEIESEAYKNRVAGTDKWNDLILKVSEEENIDPVFVKCIMALESAGDADLVHYNKNNTYDSGLMQVNSTWSSNFDIDKLTTDTEYAIRCGIQVIKAKIDAAEKSGKMPTVHEVAWRYNGYSSAGYEYANKFVTLYADLSKNTGNNSIILNSETETEKLIKIV